MMHLSAAFVLAQPLRLTPALSRRHVCGFSSTATSSSSPPQPCARRDQSPRMGSPTPDADSSDIDTYNAWIVAQQEKRTQLGTASSLGAQLVLSRAQDTASPPPFVRTSLFHAGAEEYASDMTAMSSPDFAVIVEETENAGLFSPCMVGKIEGQFLKMVAQIARAERVLDVGTFTGYSAVAFADGIGPDGVVITLEADQKTAAVARNVFARAKNGAKISLIEGDARAEVQRMHDSGEKFDIIFLDADKTNYRNYYDLGLDMLTEGGIIMADNALGSLVYNDEDVARQSLHEFAQYVRADPRVEQVMVTVREGVLVVRKV